MTRGELGGVAQRAEDLAAVGSSGVLREGGGQFFSLPLLLGGHLAGEFAVAVAVAVLAGGPRLSRVCRSRRGLPSPGRRRVWILAAAVLIIGC